MSGTFRPLNGNRHTLSAMAEEWRVSLVIDGRGGTLKGSYYRDLLRNRLGDDVTVSAEKMHVYLYTGSAKAADEAGQVARAVLEEQGQLAEVRLERWDASGGGWQGLGEPAERGDAPGPGRLRRGAGAVLRGAAEAAMWGGF
jgi:hypothetical protein